MEDFYAILGLDREASPESIKLAFRRLARENHPDRNGGSNEAERSALSVRMSELNGAYAVLSDASRRREYDEKLRLLSTLAGSTVLQTTKTATKPETSRRARTPHEDDLTLVRELSKQVRSNLLADRKGGFSWEEVTLEGFDWGLESVSWSSHFCTAARAFAVLDLAAAHKFANYAEFVITRCHRSIRKSHFLFLLPFQQMTHSDSVSIEFNRLISTEKRQVKVDVPVGIVLFDARRGRTMRVGGKAQEKRFEELLQSFGTILANS